MNLNQATIAGNLTRRPELKSIPSGAKVASFSVATNEHYTDANGNKQQKTTFHNVKVWGPQAENCAKYLVKGQSVLVAGKIENSSYKGKDDVTKYRSEIIARAVQFGPKPKGYEEKPNTGSPDNGQDTPDATDKDLAQFGKEGDNQDSAKSTEPVIEYPDDDIDPSDIPF